jgi:hypothetical protein
MGSAEINRKKLNDRGALSCPKIAIAAGVRRPCNIAKARDGPVCIARGRQGGPISHRSNGHVPAWLPADLRRRLRTIATRERMTVQELLRVAVRELVSAYQATKPGSKHASAVTLADSRAARKLPAAEDGLETVWTPHRDAPPLLAPRESKTP